MKKISKNFRTKDFKLCYIRDGFAYFTTLDLKDQWGDDWNDIPYEHNAGTPYLMGNNEIIKIAFETELIEPNRGHINSPFSVEVLNKETFPWLRSEEWADDKISIYAGTDILTFIKIIKETGGNIFVPYEWLELN